MKRASSKTRARRGPNTRIRSASLFRIIRWAEGCDDVDDDDDDDEDGDDEGIAP